MNPRAALRELSARGIRVVVIGDRLRLRGPDHVLTAELTEHLRQHKTESSGRLAGARCAASAAR